MEIEKIIEKMKLDKSVRRSIVRRLHKFFFLFYFPHYADLSFAPMHEELFNLTQNDEHSMWVISAFRGSGKSTILTLSYVIWSVISRQTKYILIVSENQQKAQTLLGHIKAELENNALLKGDLGPFEDQSATWNSGSIMLKDYNTRITAISTEQSVRGLRFLNHRPDLVILDDCENQESVRTQESRDKLSRWLSAEVIPAGHSKTRVVVIGSMLHTDSLIPRLQKKIDAKHINGVYRMWPIVDDKGSSAWPSKFPNQEAIDREKARGIDEREWLVEYMLIPQSVKEQVIKSENIHYYDHAPALSDGDVYTGVDLAISQSESADYTAMVSGKVIRDRGEWKLYILPHPINERMNAAEIEDRIYTYSIFLGNGTPTTMYIEKVAFQDVIIQHVQLRGIPAIGVSPHGQDKRARLISAAASIRNGKVVFPKQGAEKLINQILYFGMERHDDLVDAIVILILKVFQNEEGDRVLIPRLPKQEPPHTQEQGEHSADNEIIFYQQGMRGDQTSMNLYKEIQRKKSADYFRQEELDMYNQLQRDSIRRRRGY